MLLKSKSNEKGQFFMMKNYFWPGIGIGVLAGAMIGAKLKAEEKHVKRSIHKAKRNMEDMFDSMGM